MSDDAVVNETNMRAMDEELSRWRRHGVLLTEDCSDCEGTGTCDVWRRAGGGPCPVCDGTGKRLKDGAGS